MSGLFALILSAPAQARSGGETLVMVIVGAAVWYGLFLVGRAFVRRLRKGFGRKHDFSGGFRP